MDADVIVVGGGILGLASALALLERSPGLRLTLLDKEPAVAVHQSGHNSGVVHAGLYYAPGTLKASLCREGKGLLETFCQEHAIPLQRCGKLVVAIDDSELDRLAELKRRGIGNGIEGLVELDAAEFREIEPNVRGVRALHVPETGVVDYRLVAERMGELLRSRGATVELGTRIEQIERDGEGLAVQTTHGRRQCGCARGLRRAPGRPRRGARRRRRSTSVSSRSAAPTGCSGKPAGEPRPRPDLPGSRPWLPVPRRPLHAPHRRRRLGRPQRDARARARGLQPRELLGP